MSDDVQFVTVGKSGGSSGLGKVDVRLDIPVTLNESMDAVAEGIYAVQNELHGLGENVVQPMFEKVLEAIKAIQQPTLTVHTASPIVNVPEINIPDITPITHVVVKIPTEFYYVAIFAPIISTLIGIACLKMW